MAPDWNEQRLAEDLSLDVGSPLALGCDRMLQVRTEEARRPNAREEEELGGEPRLDGGIHMGCIFVVGDGVAHITLNASLYGTLRMWAQGCSKGFHILPSLLID